MRLRDGGRRAGESVCRRGAFESGRHARQQLFDIVNSVLDVMGFYQSAACKWFKM